MTLELKAHQLARGDGPQLVFLHALGALTSGRYANELAGLLNQSCGAGMVGLDAPGFGDAALAARDDYEISVYAAAVAGRIRELGLGRPVLVGHSWGGVVACHVAARAADAVGGLVLLDAGHVDYPDQAPAGIGSDDQVAGLVAGFEAATAELTVDSEDALEAAEQEGVRRPLSPAMRAGIRAGFRHAEGRWTPIARPQARAWAMTALGMDRVSSTWPAIAGSGVAVLLLLASEPSEAREANVVASERFRTAIPHAETGFVDGGGHDLLADAGPAVARAVDAWLHRSVS
jgi:pimeloyl-ACP methyl ester carboxylesterase